MFKIDQSIYSDAPVFQARLVESQIQIRGVTKCTLGHQIDCTSSECSDGIFAEWSWDGACLEAKTDRYGMFPLFYAVTDSMISISTSCFKLIETGTRSRIDWPALAVFLRVGFFVGEDTVFSSIRIMPPDGVLSWKNGRLSVNGQLRIVPPSSISYEKAVGAYVDIFRAAVRRRLPDNGRVALPLSGGRDSRHILFELISQGVRPAFCITGRRFPPDQRDDEKIAATLAKAVNVPHRVVGPPARELQSLVAANVKTNMTAPRRGWKMAIFETLLESSISSSYDGIGGDMLSGGSALTESRLRLFENRDYEGFCRLIFGQADTRIAAVVPNEVHRRMTDDIAMERLLPELRNHEAAVNPTTSFYFWNRTRRFDSTNPYGMLIDIPTVYSPFLDHELVEMLLSLPSRLVSSGQLHDDVISRAYPQYSHIPYESKYREQRRDPRRMRSTTNDLVRLFLDRHPSRLVRRRFTLPRLTARVLSLGYNSFGSWWLSLVTFLSVLDAVVYRGAAASETTDEWRSSDGKHI